MSLLITLGNHPTVGVLVAAVSVVVLFALELRVLALGRPGRANKVLSVIGLSLAALSCLFMIAHLIARIRA